MKIKTIILFVAVVVLAACSKDLLDVTFDADYETKSTMDVTAVKGNGEFSSLDTIDIATNAEVKKYLDNIKSFELNGNIIRFENVPLNFNIETLNIFIKDLDDLGVSEINLTLSNISVAEAFEVTIDYTEAQKTALETMLTKKHKVRIETNGIADASDISFDVVSILKTKVTASPLK